MVQPVGMLFLDSPFPTGVTKSGFNSLPPDIHLHILEAANTNSIHDLFNLLAASRPCARVFWAHSRQLFAPFARRCAGEFFLLANILAKLNAISSSYRSREQLERALGGNSRFSPGETIHDYLYSHRDRVIRTLEDRESVQDLIYIDQKEVLRMHCNVMKILKGICLRVGSSAEPTQAEIASAYVRFMTCAIMQLCDKARADNIILFETNELMSMTRKIHAMCAEIAGVKKMDVTPHTIGKWMEGAFIFDICVSGKILNSKWPKLNGLCSNNS